MKKSLLLVCVLIAAGGCAGMRAAQAKDAHMPQAAQSHTCQHACTGRWGSARTMLFAQDYQVKSADAAAGVTLETEWKAKKHGSDRYLFQGTAPTPASCKVVATKAIKNAKGDTQMERDWHMEWNLIKQVDTV